MLQTQTITRVLCDICGKELHTRRNAVRVSRFSTRVDVRFDVVCRAGVPDICQECTLHLLMDALTEERKKDNEAL